MPGLLGRPAKWPQCPVKCRPHESQGRADRFNFIQLEFLAPRIHYDNTTWSPACTTFQGCHFAISRHRQFIMNAIFKCNTFGINILRKKLRLGACSKTLALQGQHVWWLSSLRHPRQILSSTSAPIFDMLLPLPRWLWWIASFLLPLRAQPDKFD